LKFESVDKKIASLTFKQISKATILIDLHVLTAKPDDSTNRNRKANAMQNNGLLTSLIQPSNVVKKKQPSVTG
jgi:hypothetical protein